MRILHVNEKFGPYGGTEQYLSQVMPAQVEQGHQVGILFDQKTDPDFRLVRWVTEYQSKGLSEGAASRYHETNRGNILEQLEAVLDDFRPEIVNLHNLRNVLVTEKILERYPVLWYCHDHYFTCLQAPPSRYFKLIEGPDNYPPDWRCGLLSALGGQLSLNPVEIYRHIKNKHWELSIMKKAQQVVVISGYMKERLHQVGFSDNQVTVVPRQVRVVPNKVSQAPRQGKLLFVGRIEPEKGLRVLVRAISELSSKNYELRVAGDGSDLEYCQGLAVKLGVESYIRFLGYQRGQVREDLYAQTDVVVFPSIWPEPFGVIGIETMAYGRPVVGFDVGGVTEWLKDGYNGLVARYNNPADLARKIEVLLAQPAKAAELGQNGRRMVIEQYTLSNHLIHLDRLYQRLVSGSLF